MCLPTAAELFFLRPRGTFASTPAAAGEPTARTGPNWMENPYLRLEIDAATGTQCSAIKLPAGFTAASIASWTAEMLEISTTIARRRRTWWSMLQRRLLLWSCWSPVRRVRPCVYGNLPPS